MAMCVITTIISIVIGIVTKHRGWCMICPMGTLQEKIAKVNPRKRKKG
ncbi:MAG TPA: 4Fe-4S binding protein [Candidatus Omnitrophica bacterium]|nr:4Fe-4S binding protein [Candidatus Omnitrophota bacterium]